MNTEPTPESTKQPETRVQSLRRQLADAERDEAQALAAEAEQEGLATTLARLTRKGIEWRQALTANHETPYSDEEVAEKLGSIRDHVLRVANKGDCGIHFGFPSATRARQMTAAIEAWRQPLSVVCQDCTIILTWKAADER